MTKLVDDDAEVMAEAVDLVLEFPDVPLAELASGLERRADAYENGPNRALAVAAQLRQYARVPHLK